jgi:hypothetical protein
MATVPPAAMKTRFRCVTAETQRGEAIHRDVESRVVANEQETALKESVNL